mgnify:CR=1 FL=1
MNINDILRRISSDLDIEDIVEKLSSYPMADLNTLLLEVFKRKSELLNPSSLNKNFKSNRFSLPSEINCLDYHKTEVKLFELAENFNICQILLSPVAPFGTGSLSKCVSQNNILTSLRNTEVLSDPTNMLCLLIADKINNICKEDYTYNLCTSSRCLRTQMYKEQSFFSHFGIFCIVSTGKDGGSYLCEKELLKFHISFYIEFLQNILHKKISIELSKRKGYKDSDGFFLRINTFINNLYPNIEIINTSDLENNYYKGLNFKIYIVDGSIRKEVVGGGFVDWINRLTNNNKMRCLTSAISIDSIV